MTVVNETMTVYVVQQTFHHDGMDGQYTQTCGVFEDEEKADALAALLTIVWERIAHPAEVEAVELTDYELDEETLDSLQEKGALDDPEVKAALNLLWPDWREHLQF